ncbi:hypothetical protein RhiirC2_796506 [Rhizophagus irregularis]|uniref:Uncharacterized protein n=1 Tax=Rhizophagus irregularis TaxID=588596 RepID=A0A2N1M9L6_9GLOM|nr:hypothetical protein RhiirC2_796506 [Rhizophagus irregularis]
MGIKVMTEIGIKVKVMIKINMGVEVMIKIGIEVKVMIKIGIEIEMMTKFTENNMGKLAGAKEMMRNRGNDIENEKETNGKKRKQKDYEKKEIMISIILVKENN